MGFCFQIAFYLHNFFGGGLMSTNILYQPIHICGNLSCDYWNVTENVIHAHWLFKVPSWWTSVRVKMKTSIVQIYVVILMLVEQKQTNKQLFLPFLSPQPNPESLYYLLLHLCFNNQLPHSVSLHEAAATKHMLVLSVIQIQKRKARHNSLTAWPKDSGRMPHN